MRKLPIVFAACVVLLPFACTKKTAEAAVVSSDEDSVKWEVCQNDYFEISYPEVYSANAKFDSQPITESELLAMDSASIVAMPMNELTLTPKAYNVDWEWPEIFIVLSRHKIDFPIRLYMETAVAINSRSRDGMNFMANTGIDSLSFDGCPALETNYVFTSESGDTLVWNQIVVQKPDYSLYYINNKYNFSVPESEELGNMILSTFKFKE